MCSYNLVNGIHACGNSNTLTNILRGKEFNFKGWVMSDWWATHGVW
jgi:beta-glucosidase